jgi:uncharacterized protein YuzE
LESEEDMKLHYDKESDILMIVLSNKKVDDSYETNYGIVSISEEGEPVMIDVFKASKFLKDLNKSLPKELKPNLTAQNVTSVAHRIK